MATTKQAEMVDQTPLLVDEYLADRVYKALLELGEAAKASEITLELEDPRITYALVRRALAGSPRFVSVDRQWDLAARYLDTSRPTERNLEEVLEGAGLPLSTAQLANELSVIYHRPAEVYLTLVARATKNDMFYFRTKSGEVGPVAWLPLTDAEDEEDVLFDNDLTQKELQRYEKAASGVSWSAKTYAQASAAIVAAMNDQPVPQRVLGALAWKSMQDKYDPRAHLVACLASDQMVWLSRPDRETVGGRWITKARAEQLNELLAQRAAELGTEDPEEAIREAIETPPEELTDGLEQRDDAAAAAADEITAPEVVEEPVPDEPMPLQITDEDLQEIARIIREREGAVDVAELLGLRYEVVPGDASFRADLATLQASLQQDERFLYVGAGRFREPNSLPLFVYSIPEFLAYPDLQFVSMDGEFMDEEIQDEGFVGTLRQDLLDPLAQDVGDEEPEYTGEHQADAERIRLVLKAHHKEIGTFPLCQVPDGFFPTDSALVEVMVKDPSGQLHEVILNHEQGVAFSLFSLYEFIEADSGGVFYLAKGARPYEYKFEPDAETDALLYIPPARMSELLALREQAEETGDMATFDITCEVLAHYAKGLLFSQLLAEINVVRRVTRRKLASILSNYYCFLQKAGTGLWRFDAKKRDLGTDVAKRKYIKR